MSISDVAQVVEAEARNLLARHLERAKEWFPHELIPWQDARIGPDGGGTVHAAAASALWVGLLTEDNLPHYFHAVASEFSPDSAMGEWSRRWAAEEQRHSTVIRDWVCVYRALDLVALERARMRQVSTGFVPGERSRSTVDGLVYLALQELATRISHWNTAELLNHSGSLVMRRVAADENLHYLFYRDLVSAALDVAPSEVVVAIDRQVSDFVMPGSGIEGFASHASVIAAAGVYDYRVHYEQVIAPVVLKHWRLESLENLTPPATAAREHLLSVISRLRRIAERMEAQRQPDRVGVARRMDSVP